MSDPLYLLKKSHRDSIKAVYEKYNFIDEDFVKYEAQENFYYKLMQEPRLYFVFQQHPNNHEKFNNSCTTFTPKFSPKEYKTISGQIQTVRIEGAVERFEYWLKSDAIPYINETTNFLEKRKLEQLNTHLSKDEKIEPINNNWLEPSTKEELQKIGKKKEANETDIVHSDIHGEYTLEKLKEEYDSQVRTNIQYGTRQTQLISELGTEKFYKEALQQQLDKRQPKSVPGIIYLISSFIFLSYVIGTIHYHLKLTFNPLIFFTVEALLLILGMIVWFKDGTERRNLIGQLVVGIFLILAGLVAYKLFT